MYQLLNKPSRIPAKIPIPTSRHTFPQPQEHEMPKRTSSAFVPQPLDWIPGAPVPSSSRKQEHLTRSHEPKVWSHLHMLVLRGRQSSSDSVFSSELEIWGLNGEQLSQSQRTGALKSDRHRFQSRSPNDILLCACFLFL